MTDPITRLNAALEGRYRIEREIGEGGMATVYLAEDLRHERKVALKVLKPELAAVVGAERFLAEIKTTANLQHPHILPLFDSGQADGFLFYATPFVEGESLRNRLNREHQLPVDEAVGIATKVAGALQAAHERGVIHRDIKPANILLSKGEPLVSDFGISLAVGAAGGGRLTETGLSLGTPHYMSPEQATGDQNVGPQTDTYALGCVLYEMLTGEPPYTGPNAQAVLGRIITGEPVSAIKIRASVPANVDAALRKALEKLPADRFATVQKLAKALGDSGFRHGEEPAAVSRGSLWNSTSAALAIGLALTVGVAAWALFRPEPPVRVSRQVLSAEGWAGVGLPFGDFAAIAPDGSSMILPIRPADTGFQLGLKASESTEVTPIRGTEGANVVVYSPDGQWIAYAVGTELLKRPVAGGSAVTLANDVATGRAGLAWLEDGTILYDQEELTSPGAATVTQISEDGGEPLGVALELTEIQYITGLPRGRGAIVIGCPGVACQGAGGGEALGAYVVDLDDGSSERVLDEVLRAWYAPTGHIVYVRPDGSVFAAAFDLRSLELAGPGVPVFEGVRVGAPRPDMVLGADGTLLYVEGPDQGGRIDRLVLIHLDGNEEVLSLAPREIGDASWSPDGQSVLYASEGHIYSYNVALETTPRQLTFEGNNFSPVYSPDGSRVAFRSNREGTNGFDLFVKNLDDDSPPRPIIALEGNEIPTQWPLDTLIVFERVGSRPARDLWTVSLSDPDDPRAEEYLSSESNLFDAVVSPESDLAAYAACESGTCQVFVRRFPEPGQPTLISEGRARADVPYWSPDGRTLYYTSGPNTGFQMMAARLQVDPVPVVLSRQPLFTTEGRWPSQGSGLHPDGDRWITARNISLDEGEGARLILVQNFFEELRQVVPD